MSTIINWLETFFGFFPLPLLEVWGRFAYIIGFGLAIGAFGGFTFRPGGRWGIGREHQAWDEKAFLSIPVTFVLIIVSGYIGSFIVLVPGAQTFESLKDLMVFLCIVLFGYPALIAVPFAYGISDLIEGVPPGFLLDWLPGYFINPSCFWIAYQLFGKNPDFRRARTWAAYLLFVLAFMSTEPLLWGYICADKFTSVISYGNITPALFFTTAITWIMAPFAMLGAFPMARKFGMFWAEIPGHVKERRLARKEWVWEAGAGRGSPETVPQPQGWPIRMVFLTPFIALVLLMVGATAYVTLRSAADDAHKLATRLHEEISDNINLQLDEYLAEKPNAAEAEISDGFNTLLRGLPIAKHGVALVVNRAGNIMASSAKANDPVAAKAIVRLRETSASPGQLKEGIQFRFDYVTEKPLSRDTWLARATAYEDRSGGHADWMVVTLMPESFYLAGVQAGNTRSAMVFAVALLLSLAVAAFLAAMVTNRLRRISQATQALAQGNLDQRAPGSRMEELNTLARSFNDMAERLKKSFAHLNGEIELRKQADQELKASEELFRTSFESATIGVCLVATNGRFLNSNRTLCEMLGYSKEELLRLTFDDVTHGEDKEVGRTFLADALSGGPKILRTEKRYLRKDGRTVWAHLSAALIEPSRDNGGYLISYIQDITERKRTEQRIRQLNRVYAVLSGINELIVRERDLQMLFEGACRIAVGKGGFRLAWIGLFKNPSEPLQMDAQAGAMPDTLAVLQRVFTDPALGCAFTKKAAETGSHAVCNDVARDPLAAPWRELALERGYRSLVSLPLNVVGRRAGVFNLYAGEAGFFDADELHLLDELAADISFALEVSQREGERKQLENQLRQTQKMEAIGTLAGGIAHDFNNILAAVIGYAEMAQRRVAGDPLTVKYLNAVLQGGTRAAALVRQILTFSRQQEHKRMPVQLRHLVSEPLNLLRATIPSSIEFDVSFATDLPAVLADATQIHQIVMNLCTNAAHAMKDRRGRLGVRLEAFGVDAHLAGANPGLRPGPYVRLSISDTGHGMTEATRARIFEPFFTTKKPGEGTGLGLSVVHGIMQTHGGAITVYSQPSEGTVFHLFFPVIADAAGEAGADFIGTPAGHGERVLFVDDEVPLALLGQSMLTELGYVVEAKTDVAEALASFQANPEAFDLVITDLTMPGMLGTDFARQILLLRPGLPIILTTGYTASLTDRLVREQGIGELLLKPLTLQTLGSAVHRVLGARVKS